MGKTKTKVVNLSKALKEAFPADEEEEKTKNNDEEMESLGSYILLNSDRRKHGISIR